MTEPRDSAEPGPGILETSLVIGLALLLATVIVVFFGGALADAIGVLVDAAHGGTERRRTGAATPGTLVAPRAGPMTLLARGGMPGTVAHRSPIG